MKSPLSVCNPRNGTIHRRADVGPVLDEIAQERSILGALIVVQERLGVMGVFPLEVLGC